MTTATLAQPDATRRPKSDADRPPTDDELAILESRSGVEFVDGELREHTMSMLAVLAKGAVYRKLTDAAEDTPALAFADGICYRCWPKKANRYRMPDASVVVTEKLKQVPRDEHGDFGTITFPPDLAVEVVSAHDNAEALQEKLMDYANAEFPLVWVLFPRTRTVEVIVAGRQQAVLDAEKGDELTLPDLLPAFRVKVAGLFPQA